MLLRITEPAKEDLLEIYQHIALDNPTAAERILRTFQEKFEFLAKFLTLVENETNYSLACAHSLPANTLFFTNLPTKF